MVHERSFEDKQCRQIMKVAISLLKLDAYGYLAGKNMADGGWLDVYSYEPLETLIFGVQRVIDAIKPFIVKGINDNWEWRCFAPDGFAEFLSDGSVIQREKEDIDE